MPEKNAAHVYKQVTQAQADREREKALSDPEAFIKLAAAQGHHFTVGDLKAQIEQLSDEEVAAIYNPGISPRRHLFPR
ncbi:MAG: Nif11-like leader peptide family RiPP precursor [Phormidesmis sp.]